jgi:cytoskeleton protein RodZ
VSAMPDHAVQPDPDVLDEERSTPEEPVVAGTPVVVRRHAGVSALIGAAASAVAIAYLWRASQSLAVLDWTLFGLMALVAAGYLASLVDARTPLLVADDLGIRIRAGHEWRGLPWEAIGHVVVHPRRGLLRDGRLVVLPHSLARALEGLDAKGRRHVMLNQKMYGAPLAVPLGLTTRVSDGSQGLADGIAALAVGRAEVVELDADTAHAPEARDSADEESPEHDGPESRVTGTAPSASTAESEAETSRQVFPRRETFPRLHGAATPDAATPEEQGEETPEGDVTPATGRTDMRGLGIGESSPEASTDLAPGDTVPGADPSGDTSQKPARRSVLGGIATIVSRVAKGSGRDLDRTDEPAPGLAADPDVEAQQSGEPQAGTPAAPGPVAPLRETRPGLRAEATLDLPQPEREDPDGSRPSEGRELRRPGSVDLVVEPVAADERVRPISTLGAPVEPLVIDEYATEPAYDPVIGPEITAARTRLGLSVDELAERTRIRPHVIESIEVDDFAPCGGDFYARGHLRTLARILGKDPAPLLAKFEERYATAPVNARRVFEAELATGMTGSMRSTVGGPNWGLLIGVVLVLVLVWGVLRLFTAGPDPAQMPVPVINGAAVVELWAPATTQASEWAVELPSTPVAAV